MSINLKKYWAVILILLTIVGFVSKALYNYPLTIMAIIGFYKVIVSPQSIWNDQALKYFIFLFLCLWIPMLLAFLDAVNPSRSVQTVFPYLRFLFAGIFITIIPAVAILKAGNNGALSSIIDIVVDSSGNPVNSMYFWITGILSGFLDNAPTYLVFFNLAGSSAPETVLMAEFLMNQAPQTLMAISAGAVFMGALTYIGNAPNFMVQSIAEENNIKMPSFFGYMLWSILILCPIFFILSMIIF